jgi:hypothetical protein
MEFDETILAGGPALTPLKVTSVTLERFVPESVIVTPTVPAAGVKELRVGALIMMKSTGLVPRPSAVVTLTLPVIAVVGTLAVICVSESIVNCAARVPNFTAIAPVKLVPMILMFSSGRALDGEKAVNFGETLKTAELSPVQFVVVTLIRPVFAPAGTVALMEVAEISVKAALTFPNLTSMVPRKFRPLIVTTVPTGPLGGVKPVTLGPTLKLIELMSVPFGVTTVTGPLFAPLGTVAVIELSELTLNCEAMPLNLTTVAPVKPVPSIVTLAPTGAHSGLKPLMPLPAATIVKL